MTNKLITRDVCGMFNLKKIKRKEKNKKRESGGK